MSRTNWDDSIENMKCMKINDIDEYKDDNLQLQHGNENVINTTK